ncbi:MAG: protein-disulfide reductase DsbD domain-containing protein [Bryobacteraceae bacterium]
MPLFLQAQQSKLIITPPSEIVAKRGATVTQTLKLEVPPGVHVNSDKPKDEFIIPLKLTWADGLLLTKSVTYPKPEEIKVGTQDLTVFTGSFTIQTQFEAPPQAPTGSGTITGKLRYQACNNQMCFRPMTADVRVPVVVE